MNSSALSIYLLVLLASFDGIQEPLVLCCYSLSFNFLSYEKKLPLTESHIGTSCCPKVIISNTCQSYAISACCLMPLVDQSPVNCVEVLMCLQCVSHGCVWKGYFFESK